MILKVFKKAIVFWSFISFSIFAYDPAFQPSWTGQILNAIGQSDPIHMCSEHIQTKIDAATTHQFMQLGDEPASLKYQELGSEAQFELGIAQEHHLPIKKINQASPIAHIIGAVAESNAIYVNEEKFDKEVFGSVRCAIFHEAAHVKYHDKVMDGMVEICMLVAGSVGAFITFKQINVEMLRKTMSFLLGLGMAAYASSEYSCFMERRADIEGHYATQCCLCVRESAQRRHRLFEIENHPCQHNGYLGALDLEKIAQDLGDKKCAYHSTL